MIGGEAADPGPSHHLADTALVTQLLGSDTAALLSGKEGAVKILRGETPLGGPFESLLALSIRVFAQAAEARVFHLRTHAGLHEIDLFVERGDGRILAIEAKLAATVDDDVTHLHWLEGSQVPGDPVAAATLRR